MKKIRWGILSTARIATEKVIPAMQAGEFGEVRAIASRNKEQAEAAAARLNIPVAHGSYEALLHDPDIDAIYNPLPNHMHVEWSVKALQAGKHVLCEKPIGLSVAEAEELLAASKKFPQLKAMEAFVYRFNPQWILAKKLVDEGKIGKLETIQSFFSFTTLDPHDIRNKKEMGGGSIMDIGCYCISLSRYLFEREPLGIFGKAGFDEAWGVDRLSSGIMDFGTGTSAFTCSTQLISYQRVNILGLQGRIEIEIPFNAPVDKPNRIWLHTANGTEEILFPVVDQYTLEADAFAKSILNNEPVPTPLEDAVNNMKVIEAFFTSAQQGKFITM
jgi:predicted dehydrogenase